MLDHFRFFFPVKSGLIQRICMMLTKIMKSNFCWGMKLLNGYTYRQTSNAYANIGMTLVWWTLQMLISAKCINGIVSVCCIDFLKESAGILDTISMSQSYSPSTTSGRRRGKRFWGKGINSCGNLRTVHFANLSSHGVCMV